MKKVIIVIILALIMVLFFTTPKQSDYSQQLKDVVKSKIEYDNVIREVDTTENGAMNDLAYEKGTELAKQIVDASIDKNTKVKNFVLFSVGYYNETQIGYGFLGTTFIDKKIIENEYNR